jgi:hypothetical protein
MQAFILFDVCDVFLLGTRDINCEKKNKIKISNLKLAKYLEVIVKEEFTTKVITILDM